MPRLQPAAKSKSARLPPHSVREDEHFCYNARNLAGKGLLHFLLRSIINDVAGICLLLGDFDVAAGAGEEVLCPVNNSDKSVAEALQIHQVQTQPCQPADEAGDFGLAHLHDGIATGDDRHGALVEVVKSFGFIGGGLFVNLGSNQLRSVSATLHSNLRQTWQTVQTHEVTNGVDIDRKSTRLNSSHVSISYAVFCL